MVDLRAKPFYLNETEIRWVEDTIASMTLDEKLSQLFVLPKEGTFVATAAEAGASEGVETAYRIGYVAGREASAVGVNWMFNPVADVYKNWRNTIVNTHSFGSDPEKVTDCVRAYQLTCWRNCCGHPVSNRGFGHAHQSRLRPGPGSRAGFSDKQDTPLARFIHP